MIQPVIFSGAFDGEHISRLFNDAHDRCIPAGVTANSTRIRLRYIFTYSAQYCISLESCEASGKLIQLILRYMQKVKRKPLGGFGSYPGEPLKRLNDLGNCL